MTDVSVSLAWEIPFERLAKFVLQADWNDVMAKAKRLIQEGKVTILHNTPESVIAQVIGDGSDNDDVPDTHQVELAREDPNSNVLTQTVCDCAYNQFRWDRTREWKGQEGRPCSHILASYWKAKSTPIDGESVPAGYQAPVGQRGPASAPGQQTIPGMSAQQTPTPEAQPQPQTQMPSTQQMVTPPQPSNPFNPPKQPGQGQPKVPQRQQLQLFNVSPPAATTPPAGGVSVPGGTPATPENPVNIPGTFSSWQLATEASAWYNEKDAQADSTAQEAEGWRSHQAFGAVAADQATEAQLKVASPEQYGDFLFHTPEEAMDISQAVVDNHQGVRDFNAFASGVQSPINQHAYGGMSDVFSLAAHTISSIQAKQGLVEGNKRTATATGLSFLVNNGHPLAYQLAYPPYDEEMHTLILQLAEGRIDSEALADYMRKAMESVEPGGIYDHFKDSNWHG